MGTGTGAATLVRPKRRGPATSWWPTLPDRVQPVLDSATERGALEEYEREVLRSRMHRFRDVYPWLPELRGLYEAQRQQR